MSEDQQKAEDNLSVERDTQNILALILGAQKQQKMNEDFMKKAEIILNNIQRGIAHETRHAVTKATQEAFSESSQFMVARARELEKLKSGIEKATNELRWKLIALWGGGIFAFIMGFTLIVFFFSPKPSEIQERQKLLEGAQLTEVDGKILVKIMTKESCYPSNNTKVYDWCPIDPKK